MTSLPTPTTTSAGRATSPRRPTGAAAVTALALVLPLVAAATATAPATAQGVSTKTARVTSAASNAPTLPVSGPTRKPIVAAPSSRKPAAKAMKGAKTTKSPAKATATTVAPATTAKPIDFTISPLAADKVAGRWMTLVYDQVKTTAVHPPGAARLYGYAGVTVYEAARSGSSDLRSLAGQLNGLTTVPSIPSGKLSPDIAIATAVNTVLPSLFAQTKGTDVPDTVTAFATLLQSETDRVRAEGTPDDVIQRSQAYGAELGQQLLNWAKADGFDSRNRIPVITPEGPQYWFKGEGSAPLEPNWGSIRTFVLPTVGACDPPAPITFSTDPGSSFYDQANTVYKTSTSLTAEQTLIADFWADGAGATSTPPGHWISIATKLIDERQLSLPAAASIYARLGVGLADAFIAGWHVKYVYWLLRPDMYITKYIDPQWKPRLATPRFPEYISGHSVGSGTAAAVLTSAFGDTPFTDTTHVNRGLPSRQFTSFTQAADEAAQSRLYGGIHYPMGNQRGLDQGRCIGKTVVTKIRTLG